MHMQIHDFVAIHLVVITADNLNTCIHLLYFCSFSSVNQDSMLREYKDVSERLFLGIVCCLDAFCKTHSLFAAFINVSQ